MGGCFADSTKRAQVLHALPAHSTLALLFEGLFFEDVWLALPRLVHVVGEYSS